MISKNAIVASFAALTLITAGAARAQADHEMAKHDSLSGKDAMMKKSAMKKHDGMAKKDAMMKHDAMKSDATSK